MWLTEGSSSSANRLTRQADLHWGAPTDGAVVVNYDPAQRLQAITGFGASFTDSATSNVMRLNPAQRSQLMTELFSPTDGIGLSILRQPIGASDFVDPRGLSGENAFYTYLNGTTIDVSRDQDSIDLVKQATALRGAMTVIGSPWSPPAQFRQSGSLLGSIPANALMLNHEQDYADYLRGVVQAYGAKGVAIDYLTVQNEPLHNPAYPGLLMGADQQIRVVEKLSSSLTAAGLGTRILGYDHNWDIPSQGWNDASWSDSNSANPAYPAQVMAATQHLANVAGTALHCYEGFPGKAGNSSLLHDRFPTKEILWTECTGTEGGDTFRDTLEYHGSRTLFTALRNWSQSIVFWNIALNESGGPLPSGGGVSVFQNCSGLVTVKNDATQGYTKNVGYYLLGHFSKFVQPGARVLASDDVTKPMGNGNNDTEVSNAVFENPDGTFAAVLYNDTQELGNPGASSRLVSLTGPKGTVSFTMPGNSMVTLTWGTPRANPDPDPVLTAVAAPAISGTAGVGGTLRATPGRYSIAPTALSYQWLRGTSAIRGATRATYSPVAADRGKRLAVRVTARRGTTTVVHASSATAAIAYGKITVKKKPRALVGKKAATRVKVGQKLKADKGSYAVARVKVTYQWLRGKKAIKGAKKATFKVTAKDRGARITLRVTVAKPGYKTVRVVSRAIRVR
ncbi:ricin-type beta-trefoil lectin domain protein [Rarobacter faecitabidus]